MLRLKEPSRLPGESYERIDLFEAPTFAVALFPGGIYLELSMKNDYLGLGPHLEMKVRLLLQFVIGVKLMSVLMLFLEPSTLIWSHLFGFR